MMKNAIKLVAGCNNT